jgi:hypothetical protein
MAAQQTRRCARAGGMGGGVFMIGWEMSFFVMVVGGVGVIGLTLVRAVVELGWRLYKKRSRRQDTPLPW